MLYDEVDSATDPLGPDNTLLIGVGPVNGTLIPGSGRVTLTALSPFTVVAGGKKPCFGDTNIGGFFGAELKYAGYDQVIIRGQSEDPVYLWISDDQIELCSANHLWGKDTLDTTKQIQRETGDQTQIICIGPAGENLVRYACVIGNLARAGGKCGIGAVMGSKKLKAVAVRGTKSVHVAQPERMKEITLDAIKTLYSDPSSVAYSELGTPSLAKLRVEADAYPTRNYQEHYFEQWQNVTAEAILPYWKKSKACFGCPLHCSHFYEVDSGDYAGTRGEGLEWGCLGGMGAYVGNANTEFILYADLVCNKLGLGVTTAGSTIAWAMECWQKGLLTKEDTDGLDLNWGDVKVISELINKISYRQGKLGDLLAEGAFRASKIVGQDSESFVCHVKGQPPGLADPRLYPAWGLSYMVASRGGDHLRALVVGESFFSPEEAEKMFGSREAVEPTGVKGKGQLVKWSEEQRAVTDSLEVCKFVVRTILSYPEWVTSFLNVVTGVDFTEKQLLQAGERIVNIERMINMRQGLTRADDTINERFLKEPLKGRVFNPKPLLDDYYEARGWDLATGYPLAETLEQLGLSFTKEGLKYYEDEEPGDDNS
jgi:aldehyde:ferredoxin oxidoreductase